MLTYPDINTFDSVKFVLKHATAQRTTLGGVQEAVGLGPSLWYAEASLVPLKIDSALGRAWRTWIDKVSTGLYDVQMMHPLYSYPRRYWVTAFTGLTVNNVPFNGTCTVQSVNAGASTITVTGVPVGFVLTTGDFVSVTVGARYYLYRIGNSVVSTSNSVTFSVSPAPGNYLINKQANFAYPSAVGRVNPESVDVTEQRLWIHIKFSTMQRL